MESVKFSLYLVVVGLAGWNFSPKIASDLMNIDTLGQRLSHKREVEHMPYEQEVVSLNLSSCWASFSIPLSVTSSYMGETLLIKKSIGTEKSL